MLIHLTAQSGSTKLRLAHMCAAVKNLTHQKKTYLTRYYHTLLNANDGKGNYTPVLRDIAGERNKMVAIGGLEPPTSSL